MTRCLGGSCSTLRPDSDELRLVESQIILDIQNADKITTEFAFCSYVHTNNHRAISNSIYYTLVYSTIHNYIYSCTVYSFHVLYSMYEYIQYSEYLK